MTLEFQDQRARKIAFKTAQQRGAIAVIELGTFKVTCHILRLFSRHSHQIKEGVEARLQRASYTVLGSGTHMSLGIQMGEITDAREAERAISCAVDKAQKVAQISVQEAVICTSGADVQSASGRGEIDLDEHEITQTDVARLMAAVELPPLPEGRTTILAQPVIYGLDHHRELQNPVGLTGRHLSVDVHVLHGDSRAIEGACNVVRHCGLKVAGILPSSYTSGLSCLHEEEMEHGVVCVDVGAGTTSVSIFCKGHLVYAGTEPVGGNNIRDDIADAFGISRRDADQLKVRHGGVYSTGADGADKIRINRLDGDLGNATISRHELIFAMQPRVLQIFEHARLHLQHAGYDQLPSQKIVLTGGVSQLTGAEEAARSLLGDNVRIGRPVCIRNAARDYEVPTGSAALGACLAVGNPQDDIWDFELPADHDQKTLFRRAVGWFKESW